MFKCRINALNLEEFLHEKESDFYLKKQPRNCRFPFSIIYTDGHFKLWSSFATNKYKYDRK